MTITARPTLFQPSMIRALLDGTKTQTRRIAKHQVLDDVPGQFDVVHENPRHASPYLDSYCGGTKTPANPRGMTEWWCWWTRDDRPCHQFKCPYGKPGDLLWVREAWSVGKCADGLKPSELSPGVWLRDNGGLWLEGHEPKHPISPRGVKRPSMFMPRWASRLTLELTDVRVERLQDISDADAIADGVWQPPFHEITCDDESCRGCPSARKRYRSLWIEINGKGTGDDSWASNPWVWALTFRVHQINVGAFLSTQRSEAA